jgi:hypothetical protein
LSLDNGAGAPSYRPAIEHSNGCRDIEAPILEKAIKAEVPEAVHVEVLTFKNEAQVAKYPPESKVTSSTRSNLLRRSGRSETVGRSTPNLYTKAEWNAASLIHTAGSVC